MSFSFSEAKKIDAKIAYGNKKWSLENNNKGETYPARCKSIPGK